MKQRKNLKNKVYSFLSRIPKGKVSTYKEVALAVGSPRAYRAVGSILNKNKDTLNIPCYKVVRSDGFVGGYRLGSLRKEQLLKRDGIEINTGKVINLYRYLFKR